MAHPSTLAEALLAWYDRSKRELPWRQTVDPYAIWVSEAMLQQTTVATVLPYYASWMERFPTVEVLAQASEEEVLAQWSGLGYYRRARHLHAGARLVSDQGWPRSSAAWREVPGVGAYTAAAIASIVLGEPVPVVDGNVERVYARFTADASEPSRLRETARAWGLRHIDPDRPGDFNQALMELGATVCRPRNPDCPACPLAEQCRARRQNRIDELPTRARKPERIELSDLIAIPYHQGLLGLEHLQEGRWWTGMWSFPRVTDDESARDALDVRLGHPQWEPVATFRHVVTRHRIAARVAIAHCPVLIESLEWVTPAELGHRPLPAPIKKAWKLAQGHDFEPAGVP